MAVSRKPLNRKAEIILRPLYPFCGRPVPVPGTLLRQLPSQSSINETKNCHGMAGHAADKTRGSEYM